MTKSNLRPSSLFLTISGITVIFAIFLYSGADISSLLEAVSNISIEHLLILSFIIFVQVLALTGRWKLVVAAITRNITFRKGYFFYITNVGLVAAALISTLFGSSGSRILSLRLEYGVRVIDATNAAVSDLAIGFFAILLMSVPAFFYYVGGLSVNLSLGLTGIVILLVLTIFAKRSRLLFELITRCFNLYLDVMNKLGPIRKFFKAKKINLEAVNSLGEKQSILLLTYSLTAYLCNVAAYWLILNMTGIELQFLHFLIIFPVIALASTISPTPGGLGTSDAVWFIVLLSQGALGASAGQFVLLRRVIYDGVILSIGAFAYLYYISVKKLSN